MKAKKMIVSDATTLIVLEKQRKLSLLCQLFEKVIIPETVYQELMAGLPSGAVLDTVACIEVETVALSERLANLLIVLDQGEAEETVKVFKTSGILEKKNTEKLEKC